MSRRHPEIVRDIREVAKERENERVRGAARAIRTRNSAAKKVGETEAQ